MLVYVGVDDEHIYMPVPPSSAAGIGNGAAEPTETNAQPPESHAHTTSAWHESNENGPAAKDENGSAAKGGLPLEAEVNDADPHEFNVIMILNIQISAKVPCFLLHSGIILLLDKCCCPQCLTGSKNIGAQRLGIALSFQMWYIEGLGKKKLQVYTK